MDMKQLRSFVEVARLRQFTEAANRVHLSQPAVSTQIRALERELGVDLLERTTKRVTLTEKGELFYSYALRMLELEQTALEKLRLYGTDDHARRIYNPFLLPASANSVWVPQ